MQKKKSNSKSMFAIPGDIVEEMYKINATTHMQRLIRPKAA
jgi:hypothetical protein